MPRIRAALSALALLAVAVGAPGIGTAAEEEPDYETTTGKSEPDYPESVDEEYRVKTKWGTIYGVVRRPVVPEGVKVPVILTYTPYNILDRPAAAQVHQSDAMAEYFVPRGYARASFDLVGTRESSGCYDHGGIREQETGAAVVDFLGSQEWSNGKVGMIGGSYDGTTQWAAAIKQPKHLTTIVPQVAIGRWYDYAYGQGVRFYSGTATPVAFDFGFGFLPPTGVTGGVDWVEALRDHATPCERVEHNDRAFLPDPVYDEFWDERDYVVHAKKIKASVLVVGSWTDYNVHPVNSYEMWEALPAGLPKKITMGQKGHSGAQLEDQQDIYHAWFDHWLLGLDTGVMKLPVSDSETATADRFQDSQWPPAETLDVPLWLGRDDTKFGELGLLGGLEVPEWTDDNPALSEDDVLNGSDTAQGAGILFAGPPVKESVRISGVPQLIADVETSGTSTFLTPVLFDEDDTGDRQVITKGLLNSRNRDGERTSEAFAEGTTWRAQVRFQPVDWVLEEDHRLGIALMSMNTAEALYPDDVRSTNTLVLDEGAMLLVPVSRHADALGYPEGRHQRPVPPAQPPVAAPPAERGPQAPRGGAAPALPATGPRAGTGVVAALLLGVAGGVRLLRRRGSTAP